MDNLAHTLLGLSVAKAGLERSSPLATTALVVSSNLPDVDVLMRLRGGALAYIEYHRGYTHSLAGVAVLAALLTLVLVFVDRMFRLRRDPFRRPVRPWRLFGVAYLGGLGHAFMDFTNSYGVRPLLPFSERWYYADLAFVVDPWIWLILGSAVVWLTARTPGRVILWCAVGVLASLPVAFAFRNPPPGLPGVPQLSRVLWFVGLAVVLTGGLLNWRVRAERLARYSLVLLVLYYGGMWLARGAVVQQARRSPPAGEIQSIAAWPAPANPLVWQAVAGASDSVYVSWAHVAGQTPEWREMTGLDAELLEALSRSHQSRAFLRFARYWSATAEEHEDGYTVVLRDLRFDLRMVATLDRDRRVTSAEVRWF